MDLTRKSADRLGGRLELTTYPVVRKIVEAVARDEWNIAFFAIDPERGLEIDYTDGAISKTGYFS